MCDNLSIGGSNNYKEKIVNAIDISRKRAGKVILSDSVICTVPSIILDKVYLKIIINRALKVKKPKLQKYSNNFYK